MLSQWNETEFQFKEKTKNRRENGKHVWMGFHSFNSDQSAQMTLLRRPHAMAGIQYKTT